MVSGLDAAYWLGVGGEGRKSWRDEKRKRKIQSRKEGDIRSKQETSRYSIRVQLQPMRQFSWPCALFYASSILPNPSLLPPTREEIPQYFPPPRLFPLALPFPST
jgi:hypothetical protein